MKNKKQFATITAIIIAILLINTNGLSLVFGDSIKHDSKTNERNQFKKFEIISSEKLSKIKELIITPVVADSGKNEIFILKNGFSKINDLAKGKYTNRYSLCVPDYSLDYIHKESGDTLNIGKIDCSDDEFDVYIDGDFRFQISKEVMKYIKSASNKIKLLNKEFKNNEDARKWYAANKDKIRLYNHYRVGFDDLIGFIDSNDTAKVIDIGCTLNRKRKGDGNERRFICDDIYEKELMDLTIKFKRSNYSQEIWYREIQTMPNKR